MKKIGDYTVDGTTNWFKRRTPLGLFAMVVFLFIGLWFLGSVLGFAGSWFDQGKKLVGPDNVSTQWKFAYDHQESLNALTTQWCSAKQVENAETNPDYKSQRVSQRVAIEERYAAVEADYNAQLENAFEAKYIRPGDVPARAPTLSDQAKQACPSVAAS